MNSTTTLIRTLTDTATPPALFNQYDRSKSTNKIRRANLARYLYDMAGRSPNTLLLGEAAGYRGCRLTGVPFTSEEILLSGVVEHELFGDYRGYRATGEWNRPSREQTATIVWSALRRVRPLPLLWNALPFHPHPPGNLLANRAPRRSELALGEPALLFLLSLFPISSIIAVGKRAAMTLSALQRSGDLPRRLRWGQIRHPAHGGKRQFLEGLSKHIGYRFESGAPLQ